MMTQCCNEWKIMMIVLDIFFVALLLLLFLLPSPLSSWCLWYNRYHCLCLYLCWCLFFVDESMLLPCCGCHSCCFFLCRWWWDCCFRWCVGLRNWQFVCALLHTTEIGPMPSMSSLHHFFSTARHHVITSSLFRLSMSSRHHFITLLGRHVITLLSPTQSRERCDTRLALQTVTEFRWPLTKQTEKSNPSTNKDARGSRRH